MNKRTIITGALILALMLVLVSALGAASNPKLEVEWTKVILLPEHSNAHCGRQVSDGGYVAVGKIDNTPQNNVDFFAVKLNRFRNVVAGWPRNYGRIAYDGANEIQETIGGYFFGGDIRSLANGGLGKGGGVVIKTDLSGNMLWHREFGGEWAGSVNTIVPFPDGSCVAGGWVISNGNQRGHLIKLTSAGVTLWEKTVSSVSIIKQLAKLPGGNLIATGTMWSGQATALDAFLLKLKPDGALYWPGPLAFGGQDFDEGKSVYLCLDSGFFVAGYGLSFSNPAQPKGFAVRTDKNGRAIWQKSYDGGGGCAFFSGREFNDGYVAVGRRGDVNYPDGWIVRLDKNGNQASQIVFGGSRYDKASTVDGTSDNGLIITGTIYPEGATKVGIYLAKIKAPITAARHWAKYE